MKTVDQWVHELMATSCDRMCDEQVWSKKDHKLLIDTLDALKDKLRVLRAPAKEEE